MPLLIACPSCRLEGHLADDEPAGMISCPGCGNQFPTQAALAPLTLSSTADNFSVWVGPNRAPTDTPPPCALRTPINITPDNGPAQAEWLRVEIRRFNDYVAHQLDLLRQQREEICRLESRAKADLVIRSQDLSRREAELNGLIEELKRREADVVNERDKLARRADEIARMEQNLQQRLDEAEEMEQDLRAELDERAAEIECQRREIEDALHEVRSRPPTVTTTSEASHPAHCCE